MERNKNYGKARRKADTRTYFRVGESVNLDEIRNWVESNGHNFTDHFMVDEQNLIKRNSNSANENVIENQVITCDTDGNYTLIAEDEFNEQYEEYAAEEEKAEA